MMKIAVIRAPFDPVCEKEVKAALDIQRSGFDLAVLIPDEEGVLPRRKRLELLRRALQPYRKAAAALQFDTEHVRNTVVFSLECADEEEALAREFYETFCTITKINSESLSDPNGALCQ